MFTLAQLFYYNKMKDKNNISDFFSLAFLEMLLNPIPCADVLGKFDSETQIKMLDNSLSDNEIKELAESKGETVESLKQAIKEFKYIFNIDYSKHREPLVQSIIGENSDNDVAELATALNLPNDKVQDAVNAVIKQLKKNQIS